MFEWYMAMIDNFYSDYKSGIITMVDFCRSTNSIIEFAINDTDLTTGQFNDLLKQKQFLEYDVLGS